MLKEEFSLYKKAIIVCKDFDIIKEYDMPSYFKFFKWLKWNVGMIIFNRYLLLASTNIDIFNNNLFNIINLNQTQMSIIKLNL